jgi:hypothetical protein
VAASTELRRDLQALRRRLWFPLIALAVALAAAGASLVFSPSEQRRFVPAGLPSAPPPFRPETYPSMDDFAALAASPKCSIRPSPTFSPKASSYQ